jgi:hypothetical protein
MSNNKVLTPYTFELRKICLLEPVLGGLNSTFDPKSLQRPETEWHARKRSQTHQFPRLARLAWIPVRVKALDSHTRHTTLNFAPVDRQCRAHAGEQRANVRSSCKCQLNASQVKEGNNLTSYRCQENSGMDMLVDKVIESRSKGGRGGVNMAQSGKLMMLTGFVRFLQGYQCCLR